MAGIKSTLLVAGLCLCVVLPARAQSAPSVDQVAVAIDNAIQRSEATRAGKENGEAVRWAIVALLGGLVGVVAWFSREKLQTIESGQQDLGMKIDQSTATINLHTTTLAKHDLVLTQLEHWKQSRDRDHAERNAENTKNLQKQVDELRAHKTG